MSAIDIFQSGFRLPEKVCILAPGPNGLGCYGAIPQSHTVVAISKAVLIDEVSRKSVWVMCHGDQGWFDRANSQFHGVRLFSKDALREAGAKLDGLSPTYYFQAPPEMLEPHNVHLVGGAIRYGTTVSGCALQFAYNFGAREILLCGVDMSGDDYWDGTRNTSGYHGEVWPAARTINALIRWLGAERGIKVASLSRTRLEVDMACSQ